MKKSAVFVLFAFLPFWFYAQKGINVSNSGTDSYDASVAINGQGDVCVVWVEEFSSTYKQIFVSVLHNGQWLGSQPIPGQSGINVKPHVARGRGSNGFVCVWHDVQNDVIMFCEYTGTSWVAPIQVSDKGRSAYGLFGEPRVAVSGNGRIVVAWMNADWGTPASDIFARTWSGGWGNIVNITGSPNVSKCPDLYPGPDNYVYCVWQENYWDGVNDSFEVHWNICDSGGNWLGNQAVTGYRRWFFKPYIAVNSSGNVMINFYFMNYSSYCGIFRISGNWTQPLIASDVGDHHNHDWYYSDSCAYGTGFLYIYRDILYNICYRTASNGSYGTSYQISGGGLTYKPSIDYRSAVGAAAAWSESGEVYCAIFDPATKPPDPPEPPPGPGPGPEPPPVPTKPIFPPVNVRYETIGIDYTVPNVRVETFENRNVFSIQYINKLTWSPSQVPAQYGANLARYRLFRKEKAGGGWSVLAEMKANEFEYYDKAQVNAANQYDYLVLGVDDTGSTAFKFNRIYWENNPENVETGVVVSQFHIYRGVPGMYDPGGWVKVSGSVFALDDTATEIRAGTIFSYAVSAIDDRGKESAKTSAAKLNNAVTLEQTNRDTRRSRNSEI